MYKISLTNSSSFLTIGIILLLIVILVERVYSYKRGNKNSKKDLISIITVAIAGFIVVCTIIVVPLFNGVKINEEVLSARFMSGFTSVEITGDDILQAKVIDWTEETQYKPVRRTLGTGINNYKEGKFKLANGESALVYTNSSKVLLIKLEDKYLLFGPNDFEDFIQDFNINIFPMD